MPDVDAPTTDDPFPYKLTAPHSANSPGGVVLELNNILTVIARFTKLIETEPGTPGDQEELAKARSRMRRAATAAAGLGLVSADEADLLADGPSDEAVAVGRRLWSMRCPCHWCEGPA